MTPHARTAQVPAGSSPGRNVADERSQNTAQPGPQLYSPCFLVTDTLQRAPYGRRWPSSARR
jgi:hypothetical protein